MAIRILLADDHPIVRQGLHWLLEQKADFEVVGECGNGMETLMLIEEYHPDILLIDLMMPGYNGLEVTRQVRERFPNTRVIILSIHEETPYVFQALEDGALGYLSKGSCPDELFTAIVEVSAGRCYLSENIRRRLEAPAARSMDSYETLTARQHEVMDLLLEGLSTAEIARRLVISPRTAEAHRALVMRKLGVSNQAELVLYAVRRGLLKVAVKSGSPGGN